MSECIIERTGTTVKADGMTASIPSDISMIAIFGTNTFYQDGDYREDGRIYVNNKPIKKWFKRIGESLVWFPILEDLHKLQKRYLAVKQKYDCYLKKEYRVAFEQVLKVKKAHVKVTHEGSCCDPWWLYTADESGVSWDWVKTPKKPLNLKIGNNFYKIDHRLSELGKRSWKFKSVLEFAINERIAKIKGEQGQILQFKIGNRIYWFKKFQYVWEKLAFPEDDVKVVVA